MSIRQLHVVQRLAPGGIEQLVSTLTREGRGLVQVVSLEGNRDELIAAWPALLEIKDQITGLGKKAGVQMNTVLSLTNVIRKSQPDSVITHHAGPLIYGGFAAKLANVPVHVHVEHDAWHYAESRPKLLGKIMRFLLRPRHAAVSEMVANAVERQIGNRPDTIPNGVDLDRFMPKDKAAARALLGLPDKMRIVGAAGRLEHVKGFDLLVKALPFLANDILIVIFGQGSEDKALRQLAALLGVERRICFAGLSSAMQDVYPAFDLFCLPSRAEGLPLALLEAQACGIRAVAHNVGGVSEAVCPATGSVVQSTGGELLARAITAHLDTHCQISPRAFVEKHFPLTNTLNAYHQLAERRHA